MHVTNAAFTPAADAPLRVLNAALAARLALANRATRVVRNSGWRVVEVDLNRSRPLLMIEQGGGRMGDLQVTGLVCQQLPSGVIVYRAHLLGCEVQLRHVPLKEKQ